jgi:hypothetical protein
MKKHTLLVVIITCWIVLILALIAKLFGANFYPTSDNNTFINVCSYIDEHLWLKYTLACIMSLILNSLSFLAILGQRFYTRTQAMIFIPLIIAMSLVSWYNQLINIIIGVILYLLPIIWLKKKWYRVLIGVVVILVFQLISIVVKDIGHWYLNQEYTLVSILLQIDSMIMTMLYYLYSNYIILKKENKQWEHGGFSSLEKKMKY